jgi:hypothetical protein
MAGIVVSSCWQLKSKVGNKGSIKIHENDFGTGFWSLANVALWELGSGLTRRSSAGDQELSKGWLSREC